MKLAMVLACAVVAGCSVQPADEIGSVQQAVGEVGCTTAGGNPYSGTSTNGKTVNIGVACGVDLEATSPDSTYYNGTTCGHAFILEDTGLSTSQNYSAYVAWPGSARTSSNCSITHLELAAWHYNGSSWVTNGYGHYDGVWDGLFCNFQLRSGDPGVSVISGSTTARVVGSAFTQSGGFFFQQPVRVGLTRGPC